MEGVKPIMKKMTLLQMVSGIAGILCGIYFLAGSEMPFDLVVGIFLLVGGICLLTAVILDKRRK